jgi:lipid A 3-O-deacylase
VTFDLVSLRFNAEFGLKYRHDNFNLSYSFIYHGRELNSHEITGSFYGSIRFAYMLH